MAGGAWKQLVARSMEEDIAARRANPGVANFGALVKAAMTKGGTIQAEERKEGASARNIARTAAYSRYPGLATSALGIDAESPELSTGTFQLPGGVQPSKVVIDEKGQPTTTYEGDVVSQKDMAKMYNELIGDINETNAQWAHVSTYKKQVPPTFDQFKDMFKSAGTGGITSPAEHEIDFLETIGVTEEHIEDYLTRNQSVTREQLIEQLKAEVNG